ncbi:MAG: cytochrome c biogenesis protein CcdA [Caldilineaceae bacterium]
MAQAVSPPKKTATSKPVSRSTTFLHAVAFVVGFGIVFTLIFGPLVVLLGHGLNQYLPLLQKFGAVLLFVFALVTLGVFRWLVNFISSRADLNTNPAAQALVDVLNFFNTLLYTERRVTEMHNVKRNWGYLSSVLMGMSFSAGWVPCIGPILSSIIILATSATTVWQGSLLLAVYSLGLGIPFLITGAAFGQATGVLRKLNRYANVVSVISGIFLLVVAWLLWSQQLQRLTTTFAGLNEFVFAVEESISGNFGTVDIFDPSLVSAMPLAFIAGLISFVSPCVLPLVPAYIGYLSGASLNSSSVK